LDGTDVTGGVSLRKEDGGVVIGLGKLATDVGRGYKCRIEAYGVFVGGLEFKCAVQAPSRGV
jgi:hypothetical protein